MANHHQVIRRIKEIPGYISEFENAFGKSEAVTIENTVEAIGSVNSLPEACHLMASTQMDSALTDEEVVDLAAFMTALEGGFPEISLPRLPSRAGKSVLLHADSAESQSRN